MNIQQLAQQYSEFFTTDNNGKIVVKSDLSEDNQGLAHSLIRSIEEGLNWSENKLLLNEFITEALDAIIDTEDANDINLEPDPYDSCLYDWVSSNSQNENFIDDCVADHLVSLPSPFNLTELLRDCQQQRKMEILRGVISYLEQALEELEGEGEEQKYSIDVWEERDRFSVILYRGEVGDEVIGEWWDEDALQMIEDGFFKLERYSFSNKVTLESVLEYCKDHGLC